MNNQFLNQKIPNEITKIISERIKEKRKKLKLSQENLAQNQWKELDN